MNLKQMIDFQKRAENDEIDFESDELENYLIAAGEYITDKAEEGKNIVLKRMREEDFARLMRELDSNIASSMNSEGMGIGLMLAKAEGVMQAYTCTLVLATLAILAEEEVI